MTKKDFEMIAEVIKDDASSWIALHGGKLGREYRDRLADIFADKLAKTNPRFNREKFLMACGVETFDKDKFEKINGYRPSYSDKRWFEARK